MASMTHNSNDEHLRRAHELLAEACRVRGQIELARVGDGSVLLTLRYQELLREVDCEVAEARLGFWSQALEMMGGRVPNVMPREEALEWYRALEGGAGLDRETCLEKNGGVLQRGTIAQEQWNEPAFTLGTEYGAMIALAVAFRMRPEEDGGVR